MATAATWAGYSVAIAPLMERYSASRISAVVLGARLDRDRRVRRTARRSTRTTRSAGRSGPCSSSQRSARSCVTNILWFRSIHRIGASRATLVANLNPFLAAVFALVLLDERMTLIQVAGGALIAGGILLARRRAPAPAVGVTSAPCPSTTSCPSRAGTTSSCGSETRSRRRTSTSTRSASRAVAYGGPETGLRDRASYVLEQGEIRLVLSSGLGPTARSPASPARTATAPRTSRSGSPTPATRTARRSRAARSGVVEPHWVEDEHGRVELATIATYGENVHTFVEPRRLLRPVPAGLRLAPRRTARARTASACARSTTWSATSSSAGWTTGSSSTSASSG